MTAKLVLAIGLLGLSGFASAQYVIGGVRYTCPVGANWNDPRCIRTLVDNGAASQNQPQQHKPVWDTRWGAIATDATSGSLGTAVGMRTKRKAEKAALADCRSKGGKQCEIDLAYFNQCAVMVLGDKTYQMQGAATLGEATQLGMKACNTTNANCRVYYADCSLPQRIQ